MIPYDFIKRIRLPRNVVKAVVFTIILGLFTHFFILTNKLINHDDLEQLVSYMDYSTSGRWFLRFANLPSSYFSMPWVNGLLIITYTSILSGIIAHLLNIRNTFHLFLLGGVMIMFPSNAALFPYTNSYDAYLFGAVLAMIGVYLFIKYQYGFIATYILTVLSLGTYQTYISLCAMVLIIFYFTKYIRTDYSTKKYIFKILKIVITYLLAIITYVLITKYFLNIELSSYQNLDKMGTIKISNLPRLIVRVYYSFYAFLIKDDYFQYGILRYMNVLLLLSTLYLIYKFIENSDLEKKIVSSITILILPIVVNIIIIMAPTSAIGLRMLQGYQGLYILFIVMLEYFTINKEKYINSFMTKASMWYISITIILSMYHFFIVTNKVYQTLDIDTTNVLSYTTRVLSKIEEQEFYERDKEVFLIGNPDITNDFTEKYTTPDVLKSTILTKKLPAHYFWKLYPMRYAAFPNNVENIWKVNYDEIEDEGLLEMIDNMPIYPKSGSIREYKNKIYIKFKNYKTN